MKKIIDVDVFFYKGMRKNPPYGDCYRPHLVVDGSDEYYSGIQFISLKKAPFEEHIIGKIELIYDEFDYSLLVENAHFLIKEGSKSVGEGVVLHICAL